MKVFTYIKIYCKLCAGFLAILHSLRDIKYSSKSLKFLLPSMDVDFYSIRRNIITKNLVSEIHKIDKKVYVWNIDTKFYMDDMIKLNVDGMITNNLDILNDKDNIMSPIK